MISAFTSKTEIALVKRFDAAAQKWAKLGGASGRSPGFKLGGRGRALAASVALGAFSSLSFPPIFAFPLLWITVPLFLCLLNGAETKKRGFLLGWGFGFGLYGASLYWVAHALVIASDALIWLTPFAGAALPAGLAVFTALASVAACLVPRGRLRILAFILAWAISEWLRGHILSGFPWNLMGHAWTGYLPLAQSAALIGMYGVTLLVIFSSAAPAFALAIAPTHSVNRDEGAPPSLRFRLACLSIALALPSAFAASGLARLNAAPALGLADTPGVGLRLVQANIPQREKWARDKISKNFQEHLTLSTQDRPDWITHIIWPETAAAFFLENDLPARRLIGSVLPQNGSLITGTVRAEVHKSSASETVNEKVQIFNSLVALDRSGTIQMTYDKAHLVPFGEYNPFDGILPLGTVTGSGFTLGTTARVQTVEGLPPFAALICYEAVFPGEIFQSKREAEKAQWLLNLTNDAWYGKTAGPHQHATMAKMRAIEEGLPLFRATNTGITIAYDSYGRELGHLGLNEKGYLDLKLPQSAMHTLYARIRDFGFLILCLGLALWLGIILVLRAKSGSP